MRSKSVDNFFQRPSNGEVRLPSGIIHEPPLPSSPPPFGETPLTCERSPSLSLLLSPNPSLSSHSPSLSPSLSLTSKAQLQGQLQGQLQARLVKTHCFQEHVFRRPTCCQQCKHVIQGNSKQGLRCKACKLGAHLWCSSELSQQPCTGKSDKGGVDPVYEALRYGTSLAQMSRSSFGSITESPIHEVESVWEGLETQPIIEEEFVPETETVNPSESEKADSEDRVSLKGKSKDKLGFFPANFVQRVRPETGLQSPLQSMSPICLYPL
ncbi:unnamed protein product [Coregonus sp. 'balchen']|nr:unnamed protein product [Coregonus sp. 'balchen']